MLNLVHMKLWLRLGLRRQKTHLALQQLRKEKRLR